VNRRAIRRAAAKSTAAAVLRVSGTPWGRRVSHYVDVLNRLMQNDSGNIALNGEAWLLSQLSGTSATVFDVGANRGNWTAEALARIPNATVHSFEPIPETFADLARRFGGNSRVLLNNAALSDHPESKLRMWTDGLDGTRSSATAPLENPGRELTVSCTTGDQYIDAHGLGHIDLLKIDVEGHEMEVLHGFQDSFSSGAIDVVQFEFTLWAAIARRWLADYYDFFDSRDFAVGKLWPREIRWKDYDAEDEQFFRCNFVAARRGSSAAATLRGF
jgi:FkbM family methyltransferase